MRPSLIAAGALALLVPFAAEACEEAQQVKCALATYCAHRSAGDGEWVSYRSPSGPVRFPKVPDDGEVVLVFVEVEGNFGNQRIYTLGNFGKCFWTFENEYVERSKKGRRILSWKRLDEPQYAQ